MGEFDRELIKQRRTSRLPYNSVPVDYKVLNELQNIARKFGQKFIFTSQKKLVDWFVNLNCDTLFYDMNDERSRDEVGLWIRYSPEDALEKKDGLWSYCMGFSGIMMYLFFHFRWFFNLPLVNSYVKARYLKSMHGTRTVGWLIGEFNKRDDWIKSGHMLARLWLTMTKYGVYMHPFGSIITNDKSHQILQNKIKVDESVNTLWLIFRLGYSDVPPRSYRFTVDDIILNG